MSDSGGNAKWLVGAVVVPIVVACIGAGVVVFEPVCLPVVCQHDDGGTTTPGRPGGETRVFLSALSGPAGTQVNVSGEGFAAGETVRVRFHTEQIGETTASASGTFVIAVTIPDSFSKFAPQQFDIVANGAISIRSARASFRITG